jgi:hypothetical protein
MSAQARSQPNPRVRIATALQRAVQPSRKAKHTENTADNHPGLAASDVARHHGNATINETHDRQEHPTVLTVLSAEPGGAVVAVIAGRAGPDGHRLRPIPGLGLGRESKLQRYLVRM